MKENHQAFVEAVFNAPVPKPPFEQKQSFEALLTTFMASGGGSIHFNVLSPEVLLKAQAEPEKYSNLQIRLCGWNVRFVNLSKKEQDEFILQSQQENGL